MIARMWRGATAAEDADAYLAYLHHTGLAAYAATPGNRGTFTFRRLVDERAEFMTLSLWESVDAVRGFAGDDIAHAVFYPEDDRYLVDRDLHVTHWDVVARSEAP